METSIAQHKTIGIYYSEDEEVAKGDRAFLKSGGQDRYLGLLRHLRNAT